MKSSFFRKLISMAVVLSMTLGFSAAYAATGDIINTSNRTEYKVVSGTDTAAELGKLIEDIKNGSYGNIGGAADKFYKENENGTYTDIAAVRNAEIAALGRYLAQMGATTPEKIVQTIMNNISEVAELLVAADASVTPIPDPKGEWNEEEITVEKIEAVNASTIYVLFSDGEPMVYEGYNLVKGLNSVTFVYKGKTYHGTVEYYPPDPSKAAVEKIDFINYRNIRVTFNKVVDEESATNPANYYFEMVDGNAAVSFAASFFPTLLDSNRFDELETDYPGGAPAWFAGDPKHIVADSSSGKTVVDIYFPEDARFTNYEDDESGEYPYYGYEDAARTIAVLLKKSATGDVNYKTLHKDTVVKVAVRNVKDADKKFSIDTVSMPIRVLDEDEPELIGINVVDTNRIIPVPEVKSNKSVYDCYELLRDNAERNQERQYLELEYNEPVYDAHYLDMSDLDYYRDINLSVNGKLVASSEKYGNLFDYLTFAMDKNSTYDESRHVILDALKLVEDAYKEEVATEKKYHIEIVGITDLAGNMEDESQHEFDVVFKDLSMEPNPQIKPEVLDLVQVADNMFRVEFNLPGVDGELIIENPDGEGIGTLKAPIGKSKKVVLEDGEEHFVSYVAVPAYDHEPIPGIPAGVMQNSILAYDGQDTIYRDMRVVRYSQDHKLYGDDRIFDDVKLVDDINAPVAENPEDMDYNDHNTKIRIPVKDIVPYTEDPTLDYWVSPIAYNYDDYEMEFLNTIKADQKPLDDGSTTYLPILVSYEAGGGAIHQAVVSNKDVRPWYGDDPTDFNPGYAHSITFDYKKDELVLNLKHYPQLLDGKGALVEGATYKVELPKGYFTDSPKDIFFWDNEGMLFVDDARDSDDYSNWFGKVDAGLGFTSAAKNVYAHINKRPDPDPDPEFVPQTSKQLIYYDEAINSLKIEFTGTIDVDTLKDKNNYAFNGKTLAEWDEELGTNTEIKYVVDDRNPEDVHQYAVFEIPQNSIKEDGNYVFEVQGVAHPNGAKMEPVKTEVRLHDTWQPVVISAEVTGDSEILLTFDEPIRYNVDPAVNADPHSTANNFKVMVNGVRLYVDTATLPAGKDNDREIILNLGSAKLLETEGDITVEIVKDQNGNILVIDWSTNKNTMREAKYDVERPDAE